MIPFDPSSTFTQLGITNLKRTSFANEDAMRTPI